MTSTQILWMVYRLLPTAFFFDLLVLPLSLWWIRRWQRARQNARRA